MEASMAVLRSVLLGHRFPFVFISSVLNKTNSGTATYKRCLSLGAALSCQEAPEDGTHTIPTEVQTIDPEQSMRYLRSKAYDKTYGNEPVWTNYKRNYKGNRWVPETRRTCIRKGLLSTGNPCPICRDEYLVVDYKNIDLIKQFISPYSGEILPSVKTGVCQVQQKKLLIAIEKAKDYGYVEEAVPFRHYDYSLYYPQIMKK